MQDKTVLAVAHRLSTIAALDRLIVLDEGRIIETGNHAELLLRDGLLCAAVASPIRRISGNLAKNQLILNTVKK